MSGFKEKVIKAVCAVPYGKVASYGQIALMVGLPRAARQVGYILNALDEDAAFGKTNVPWWRIVNNEGRISIKGTVYNDALVQKKKLESEGIIVKDNLTFDINKYRFIPDPETLKKIELDEIYIKMVMDKYLL